MEHSQQSSLQTPCQATRQQTLALAKHPGFTAHFTMMVVRGVRSLMAFVEKQNERQKSRRTVRDMMQLDDAILNDINLNRGDLHYVLKTKSPILPSVRLKLIALQRRTQDRAAAERYQDYLDGLVPAPFNGKATRTEKQAA